MVLDQVGMTWQPDVLLQDNVGYGILSTAGDGSLLAYAALIAGNAFNGTSIMPGLNTILYGQVLVPVPTTVYKLAWLNGATVAGNVDVAIVDESGNRLVSTGSQAQAGVSLPQVVDVTDTVIPAGVLYLALATSSATATFQRGFVTSQLARVSGLRQETNFPIPATATFGTPTGSNVPLIAAVVGGPTF
jgi:hypothetical protein